MPFQFFLLNFIMIYFVSSGLAGGCLSPWEVGKCQVLRPQLCCCRDPSEQVPTAPKQFHFLQREMAVFGWALPSHLYNSQDSSSILTCPRIPGRELHITFCLFCINFIWKRQDCEDFGMGALFQLRLLETILLLRVITQ